MRRCIRLSQLLKVSRDVRLRLIGWRGILPIGQVLGVTQASANE